MYIFLIPPRYPRIDSQYTIVSTGALLKVVTQEPAIDICVLDYKGILPPATDQLLFIR